MENVPGVYSSIEYNLCFIDKITKCLAKENDTSYYDFKDCENWIDDEIIKIKSIIEARKKRVDEFNKESLSKKIAIKALEKAEKSLDQINIIDLHMCPSMWMIKLILLKFKFCFSVLFR